MTQKEIDFINKLKQDIIPRIEEIIRKEKEHLKWLRRNNANNEMIELSKIRIKHYKLRYKQYNKYVR